MAADDSFSERHVQPVKQAQALTCRLGYQILRSSAHRPATTSGRELPLLQMVLDEPEVVDAEPVGQLDLLEGVGEQAVLVAGFPRPWELVLVEDPESHGGP